MSDQAEALRRLVAERSGRAALAGAPPATASAVKTRSLVFMSGKGGVGTSNMALNLALALGEMGRSVLLIDADLGLANLDLLCGITPALDLGDVLSGEATLSEAVVTGPFGVRIMPGAHAIRTAPEALGGGPARLAAELAGLERSAEFLIVDAGSGLTDVGLTMAASADDVVVVTTPEPTALADSHAALSRLRGLTGPRLRLLVNQARSLGEAHEVLDRVRRSSREFLGVTVAPLGHVRHDLRVCRSVRDRTPFLVAWPRCPASRGVRRLSRALAAESERPGASQSRRFGFLRALGARRGPIPLDA